jgi:hypothetical protein
VNQPNKCEMARCCGQRYQRFKADGGMHQCIFCNRELQYSPGPGTRKPRTYVERGLSRSEKTVRINLGLELLSRRLRLGQCCSHIEIATWCGCSNGLILEIEQRALRKLRKKMPASVFAKEAA